MNYDELGGYTDEQLSAELQRRKDKAAAPPLAMALHNCDFNPLRRMLIDHLAVTVKEGWENDDIRGYAFEAAMKAVFGNGYWSWRNKQSWN